MARWVVRRRAEPDSPRLTESAAEFVLVKAFLDKVRDHSTYRGPTRDISICASSDQPSGREARRDDRGAPDQSIVSTQG